MNLTNKKLVLLTAILFVGILVLTGCNPSGNDDVPDGNTEEDFIVIECPEKGETEVSITDLKTLSAVTEEIVTIDDAGDVEDQYQIQGVLLEDVLEHLGISSENLDTIRISAGDGYSVEVPNHILIRRKIILAYAIDGEPLFEGTRPIRMFIPEEESMYWVKNTVKISLTRGETDDPQGTSGEAGPLERIVFFETLQPLLDIVDYADEAGAKAVKTAELLDDVQVSNLVHMLASDGFEKNEELDTFLEHYIVIQGDNSPAFRGLVLPRGMHVKNLVALSSGNTGFIFVEEGLEYFEAVEVGSDSGVGFKELIDKLGLKVADTYILESDDGYTVEVSYEDLAAGIVYFRESGELASAFEGLPKSTSVKHLLSISVVE